MASNTESFLVDVSPLNHGSFGMVFAATDTLTGADVAIKCITKPGAAEATPCPAAIAIDDKSEELDIHSHLSPHPNIVNFVHSFDTDNHQYMVLELCPNGDLYEAIRVGRGPLETEHVRDFMLQLVDAVDHLHSSGVYHRDIKPENIFLTSSGAMKLGDFGLATMDTWSTEFAVGSDRYMAPEQFDASVYGYGYSPAAADVWAIGIVLLNILFQRNPFAVPTQKDPLFADFARDRQSLFDVFSNMSQDTYNVLVHSMALDPANRSLAGVREALKAAVSFTTDDESLDDFCTAEPTPLAPVATAAREPLRTPSITSPNPGGDSFPWASALLKTPQKTTRQLSTIRDEEHEMFPGSVKSSEWQYVDTDEASLSSNLDSGLGMSYKSAKSVKSIASRRPLSNLVGSLPISFARPTVKINTSPYGGSTGNGFSKSWSDLWDEDEEEQQEQRNSMEEPDMERVDTVKPCTPRLDSIKEDDRGSVTPRQGVVDTDASLRTATASPLRQLVEADKKSEQGQSPKQRSASIMDKWAVLGSFRRKAEQVITPATATPTTVVATPVKTSYAERFANLTPFGGSKKQLSTSRSRDRAPSWRQGSPVRLRSGSNNNSRVWERKEPSPTTTEPWARDSNWREHKSTPAVAKITSSSPPPHTHTQQRKPEKNFLDTQFDDDSSEWVGGWKDFHI
ncbi:cAMP-dependent protein kinase catalytic subunit [Teratosphaeriaceae sp. CCFEE 6253]|nr:cAMP-dependent protein kinase catalytic subunit [Teratosphaeriaceae sp. CCFEE 6253]